MVCDSVYCEMAHVLSLLLCLFAYSCIKPVTCLTFFGTIYFGCIYTNYFSLKHASYRNARSITKAFSCHQPAPRRTTCAPLVP